MAIILDGSFLKDNQGRTRMLRGVNLGGSSKVPFTPDGATWRREGFFNHREVSFIGRPFPLEEADEHFSRLRAWGFNFLRFLITWEAIEHAGPGMYDEAYLDYLVKVVGKAGDYGFDLFIDPHEDVWSRFSGGDGAPGWTFEAVGMDITHFKETGAAIVHQTHGDPFPRMIWPTNNGKLAAATMFTLFFGSRDFAPQTLIEGESAQDYLQRHYIESIAQVARRLRGFDHVVGYDTLNEPGFGYIGWEDLNSPISEVQTGELPSPFQSMLLGDGIPQDVTVWERGVFGARKLGTHRMNPERARAWLEGKPCIWRQHGIWDLDSQGNPVLLRPAHFSTVKGHKVDFSQDYLRPFANRFAEAIRREDPKALIFMETAPGLSPPKWSSEDAPRMVHAPHWYDGVVLFLKRYYPLLGVDTFTMKLQFGKNQIRKSFAAQLKRMKDYSAEHLGGAPTLIGEIGIPLDLNKARAYRSGDFKDQIRALDRSMRALDDNLLSYTLWNYTADNTNAHGDQWNDEDLSIFSRDQQKNPADINSGGRALEALLRPYPLATAGEPLEMDFDWQSGEFTFRFRDDPKASAATEFYLPARQYLNGVEVRVSDGSYEVDLAGQRLIWKHDKQKAEHTLILKRK